MACSYAIALACGWRELRHEASAAILIDVDAHDLLEDAFRLKAKIARAACVNALWPAFHNARHQRIGFAPDARCHPLARDPAQRRDLLSDGAANARHGEVDARAKLVAR